MKIFELLNETPEQQYDLHRISEYISNYIVRSSPRGTDSSYSTSFSENILKMVPESILNGLRPKFQNIEIRVRYVPVNSASVVKLRSQYMPGADFITLAVPVNTDGSVTDIDEVTSSLVHEFRHALDNSLIKSSLDGHSSDEVNGAFAKPVKGTEMQVSNTELNAKFSQAMHYLTRLIKAGKVNSTNLKQKILQILDRYEISAIFGNSIENKKLRHLFNQMYKFGIDAMHQ